MSTEQILVMPFLQVRPNLLINSTYQWLECFNQVCLPIWALTSTRLTMLQWYMPLPSPYSPFLVLSLRSALVQGIGLPFWCKTISFALSRQVVLKNAMLIGSCGESSLGVMRSFMTRVAIIRLGSWLLWRKVVLYLQLLFTWEVSIVSATLTEVSNWKSCL